VPVAPCPAAADNTAFLPLGLSYTFYNLANNPEHQKKCREEITCVLGEKENVEM